MLNDHGTAEGWKTLLRHVVSQKAAKAKADNKRQALLDQGC